LTIDFLADTAEYAPRLLSKKPLSASQRQEKASLATYNEDNDEDNDEDEVAPPGRLPSRRSRTRNGMINGKISHRASQSVRRAAALGDISAGLAEEYDPRGSRANQNRTMRGRQSPRLFLNELDYAMDGMGTIPGMDLSAYDPPRTGYPTIRSVSLQEGADVEAKQINPPELADYVSSATELGGRDFQSVIMRHREPRCSKFKKHHFQLKMKNKNLS
jgi:hypothetical protein